MTYTVPYGSINVYFKVTMYTARLSFSNSNKTLFTCLHLAGKDNILLFFIVESR